MSVGHYFYKYKLHGDIYCRLLWYVIHLQRLSRGFPAACPSASLSPRFPRSYRDCRGGTISSNAISTSIASDVPEPKLLTLQLAMFGSPAHGRTTTRSALSQNCVAFSSARIWRSSSSAVVISFRQRGCDAERRLQRKLRSTGEKNVNFAGNELPESRLVSLNARNLQKLEGKILALLVAKLD
jgi:hypothetical protein